MSAAGGHGQGTTEVGGGGAGGHISVQCEHMHKFNVSMTAHGGQLEGSKGQIHFLCVLLLFCLTFCYFLLKVARLVVSQNIQNMFLPIVQMCIKFMFCF